MKKILKDIIGLSKPIESLRTSGLYFLFQDTRLVYIGYSNTCESRVNMHISEGIKIFDRFAIVNIGANKRRLASDLIQYFQPLYNTANNADRGLVTIEEFPETANLGWRRWEGIKKKYRIPYSYSTYRGSLRLYRRDALEAALKGEYIIPN